MARTNFQVLELAGLAPAPVCGMILADHGAEVLRIDKVNIFGGLEGFHGGQGGRKEVFGS